MIYLGNPSNCIESDPIEYADNVGKFKWAGQSWIVGKEGKSDNGTYKNRMSCSPIPTAVSGH